jgi:hypothetical protein
VIGQDQDSVTFGPGVLIILLIVLIIVAIVYLLRRL